MINLMKEGLAIQQEIVDANQYYRDVFGNEPLADILADAAPNGVTAWCEPKTGRCRICKTCPDGWHAVNGIIQ